MATQFEIDLALFAANAYAASTRVVDAINVVPIPAGWSQLAGFSQDLSTGFLARAYKNDTTQEIVDRFSADLHALAARVAA